MLDLKSHRWSELAHAYGNAKDIPDLLVQLASSELSAARLDDLLEDLWSKLCHQGSVYTATYAAIPHIAMIAKNQSASEQIQLLCFIGFAETMRKTGFFASIPADIEEGYMDGLHQAGELVISLLSRAWSEEEYKHLIGTLASVRGFHKLGVGIMYLDEHSYCPHCAAIFPSPGYRFFIDEEIFEEGVSEFDEEKHAQLLEWVNKHPRGIVMTIPKDVSKAKLVHMAGCTLITEPKDLSSTLRICAPDMQQLMRWTDQHGYLWKHEQCLICNPGP